MNTNRNQNQNFRNHFSKNKSHKFQTNRRRGDRSFKTELLNDHSHQGNNRGFNNSQWQGSGDRSGMMSYPSYRSLNQENYGLDDGRVAVGYPSTQNRLHQDSQFNQNATQPLYEWDRNARSNVYFSSGSHSQPYDDHFQNYRANQPSYDPHMGSLNNQWSSMNEGTHQYTGKEPKGYKRSDERIKEDVCETLSNNPCIDASEIEVDVQEGEVTLSGTVCNRQEKRLAEDLIENTSGVKDINNRLRAQDKLQDSSMMSQHNTMNTPSFASQQKKENKSKAI